MFAENPEGEEILLTDLIVTDEELVRAIMADPFHSDMEALGFHSVSDLANQLNSAEGM